MPEDPSEFLALERAIAPFAEGFEVRSADDGRISGVFLHRMGNNGTEIGVFAGLLKDADAYPHFRAADPPQALVMAYVSPRGSATVAVDLMGHGASPWDAPPVIGRKNAA